MPVDIIDLEYLEEEEELPPLPDDDLFGEEREQVEEQPKGARSLVAVCQGSE